MSDVQFYVLLFIFTVNVVILLHLESKLHLATVVNDVLVDTMLKSQKSVLDIANITAHLQSCMEEQVMKKRVPERFAQAFSKITSNKAVAAKDFYITFLKEHGVAPHEFVGDYGDKVKSMEQEARS